ncbi:MAG: PorV/PorQ family protein [Bacteroidetes bacterium]|nr:PorV/PorQ family protein [Bacteroidota bacterium]
MKTRFSFIGLALILVTSVAMGQSKVGTSTATFLGIGIGPDAIGMGSAVVASKTGASSLYWNPGAAGSKPRNEVYFTKTNWLVGSKYDWLGATIAVTDASVIGLQFGRLSYGEEEVVTELDEDGTGERWDASDLFVGVTYSHALTEQFTLGGTAKYIRSQIWHETASAFALDLGLLYNFQWNGLKLGMSVSNFGQDMRYEGKDLFKSYDDDPSSSGNNGKISTALKTEYWPLPIFFRVGLAMDVYRDDMNSLIIAADAQRPSNHNESVNIGTEYGFNDNVFLRVGMKNLFRGESQEGLAFGVGIAYPIFGYNLKFDVSHSQMELFDGITVYGLSLQF